MLVLVSYISRWGLHNQTEVMKVKQILPWYLVLLNLTFVYTANVYEQNNLFSDLHRNIHSLNTLIFMSVKIAERQLMTFAVS